VRTLTSTRKRVIQPAGAPANGTSLGHNVFRRWVLTMARQQCYQATENSPACRFGCVSYQNGCCRYFSKRNG